MCGRWCLNVQRVAAKLYRTAKCGGSCASNQVNSQELRTLHPATNKTLNKMPHHSTNTILLLSVTTFCNKTNKRLTPED